jgi:hypothetical protein
VPLRVKKPPLKFLQSNDEARLLCIDFGLSRLESFRASMAGVGPVTAIGWANPNVRNPSEAVGHSPSANDN